MLQGDATCLFLREWVKERAGADLEGYVPREIDAAAREVGPEMMAQCAPLKKSLNRAAKYPSKRGVGKRFGARHGAE
jgi:hypothetical protein